MTKIVEEILNFWFVECNPEQWFKKDFEFDNQLRERFFSIYESACLGKFDYFRNDSQECLALIIMLDQFSRNFFRNDKKAFKQDNKALKLCRHSINNGYLDDYKNDEKLFSLLPLIHSEKLEIHKLALEMLERYLRCHPRYESIKDFWLQHSNAIKKFGRYPHRNIVLDRKSTEEEIRFLKGPNSSW